MLQLYLQYLENGVVPLKKDNSCESVAQTMKEYDSSSVKSSESQDLPLPGPIQFPKKQYSQLPQELLLNQHDLNYDISWDDVNCNILKDLSYLQDSSKKISMIPPTRMVLGLAIPEGYEFKRLLDRITEYFKQIEYIRIFHDVDYVYQNNELVTIYKKQSLIVFVFHEEQQAFMFQKEMNCYLLSYERQEYLYLLFLHKMVFQPFRKVKIFKNYQVQPLEPDENPLDVAQQQAILGNINFTLLPKCLTCLEKIDGSLSGVDYSKQIDMQVIYSNQARWMEQKKLCKVCSVVYQGQVNEYYKDESKLQQSKPICQICQEDQDVWICLICGNLGCGRYKMTHAQGHQLQTNHIFSLELLTGRLWDYNQDNFVHRLLKSGDKSILNLPDSQKVDTEPQSSKQFEEEVEQVINQNIKVILESCYEMTRQMEAQRMYYEELLDKEKLRQEKDTQTIEMTKRSLLVKSYIDQEDQKQNTTLQKLDEMKKHQKILKQKITKMDQDIQQQQYFNESMQEKMINLAEQHKKQTLSNPKLEKIIDEDQLKLEQLNQQLEILYKQLEE